MFWNCQFIELSYNGNTRLKAFLNVEILEMFSYLETGNLFTWVKLLEMSGYFEIDTFLKLS